MSDYANSEIKKGDYVLITEMDYGPFSEYTPLTGIPSVVVSLSWPFALLNAGGSANPVDRRRVTLVKTSKEYYEGYFSMAKRPPAPDPTTTHATTTCPSCGGMMRVLLSPNNICLLYTSDAADE